ncbi:MAG TPA: phosphatidylinositol mannoside acyltransferase [Mycobacteriales bacterium]|nr:phosphatidylinositol mannoside acyltransferase [Mycobacteriales bacterium]
MTLRSWGTGAAYAAGWAAVQRLPERSAQRLFTAGADLAGRRPGKGIIRLRANLARVVAATPALAGTDLDELTRAAVRSYARYWQEVFRLPVTPTERIVRDMHMADDARLRAAYAAGRGVILALPHTGNWDHAGAWLVATGIPFTTVAERLEPASLFDRFVAFREGLGMEVLPLTGGELPPFEVLASRLRAGGMLCLLADRDLTTGGVPVQFFGATATMPAGPALLAVRTGAALLPVTLQFDDPSPWCGQVHPQVLDPGTGRLAERVTAMTQSMADAFAAGIAAHPADWHMLARLWQEDLDPARRARRGQPVAVPQ